MVAQMVKNLPVMWETEFNPWVGKKGMATRSVFFSGESHGPRSLAGYSALVCKGSDMTEWLHYFFYFLNGIWRSVEEFETMNRIRVVLSQHEYEEKGRPW